MYDLSKFAEYPTWAKIFIGITAIQFLVVILMPLFVKPIQKDNIALPQGGSGTNHSLDETNKVNPKAKIKFKKKNEPRGSAKISTSQRIPSTLPLEIAPTESASGKPQSRGGFIKATNVKGLTIEGNTYVGNGDFADLDNVTDVKAANNKHIAPGDLKK